MISDFISIVIIVWLLQKAHSFTPGVSERYQNNQSQFIEMVCQITCFNEQAWHLIFPALTAVGSQSCMMINVSEIILP